MASIFRPHGTVWYIQFCDHGRQVQKSLHTKEKRLADERKTTFEYHIDRGLSPGESLFKALQNSKKSIETDGAPGSAKDFFERFKQSREGVTDKKTNATVNVRIQDFIDRAWIVKMSDITEESLKRYLDTRISSNEIGNKTANHIIVQIGTFINYCKRKKLVSDNPLSEMARYKEDQIPPRFLSLDESKELLELASKTKIKHVVMLAYYQGLRWGEISRLDWEDINFDTDRLLVRKTKTSKFRVVHLDLNLKEALLPVRGSGRIVRMTYDQMKVEFERIRNTMIERGLKKTPKVAVEYFHLHDLRHTFASMAISAGVNILQLSKWLGHSVVKTTEIYAHLYDCDSQDAMKKLSEFRRI